jgi:RNA polymerase sigma factor (sigma-70 family)
MSYIKRDGVYDYGDYLNAGISGLYRATKDYDSKRSKFSTYAHNWIWQYIIRFHQNNSHTVKIPTHAWVEIRKCNYEVNKKTSYAARAMNPNLELKEYYSFASYDPRKDMCKGIRDLLKVLNKREKIVIEMICAGKMLRQIGKKFNLTHQRILQIKQEAIGKMRKVAGK